jgi:predicted DNA-binding antitoxin AbrB/MazE fold protein
MKQTIEAIYESGLLRPLSPLNLAEQQRVTVVVQNEDDEDWLDHDAMALAQREGDETISLEEVRSRLSKIKGSLAETVIAERGEY